MKDTSHVVFDTLEAASASPEHRGHNRVYRVRPAGDLAEMYVVAKSPEQAAGIAARRSGYVVELADPKRLSPASERRVKEVEGMLKALAEDTRRAIIDALLPELQRRAK